jgi:signal transduction histidine kinase
MISPALSDTRTAALATLGGMVSTIAHELRNLLGPIDLYAALLAEQCAQRPELAVTSGRLLAGVKQLGAVAANLLSVSRRPAVEKAPVELGQLLMETVESVRPTIRGSGISVAIPRRTDKAWVLGDAERLRQAVLNVLLNGAQAMTDGGTLTARIISTETHVELRIRDTGIGMDARTLARAPEPFFTTRPNGTGLGLAVVSEIVAGHDAELRLASRRGHGTTVRMIFPVPETPGAPAPSDRR